MSFLTKNWDPGGSELGESEKRIPDLRRSRKSHFRTSGRFWDGLFFECSKGSGHPKSTFPGCPEALSGFIRFTMQKSVSNRELGFLLIFWAKLARWAGQKLQKIQKCKTPGRPKSTFPASPEVLSSAIGFAMQKRARNTKLAFWSIFVAELVENWVQKSVFLRFEKHPMKTSR